MSLLDKLRKAYKGANREDSKAKTKTTTKKQSKPKKKDDKDKPKKPSTATKQTPKTQNTSSRGNSGAVTKTTSSAPKSWGEVAKGTSAGDAYRAKIKQQAEANKFRYGNQTKAPTRAETMGATKRDVNNATQINRDNQSKTRAYQKDQRVEAQKRQQAEEEAKKKKQEELQKARKQKKGQASLKAVNELVNDKDYQNQKEEIQLRAGSAYINQMKQDGYDIDTINRMLQTEEGKKARDKFVNKIVADFERNYSKNVAEEAQKNIGTTYEAKVSAQEEKDKNNAGIKYAGANGATADDVISANKQSAVANTKLHKDNRFVAGLIDNVLPSAWGATEWGDSAYYTDAQKQQIAESQRGLAYGAGALVGNAVQFAMPAGLATKVGSKVIKGGSAGAKLTKNIGLETAFNTPLNAIQSYRDSKDMDGNADMGAFAWNMTQNTLLDAGIGGALGGAGMAFTKLEANKLVKLQAKADSGVPLTGDERKQLIDLYDKMNAKSKETSNASSGIAEDAVKNVDNATRLTKEETDELVNLKAKDASGTATRDDVARMGQLEEKADVVLRERNIQRTEARVKSLEKLQSDTGVNYKLVSEDEMHAKAKELDKEYDPSNDYNGVKFDDENGKPTVYINKDSEKSFYVTVGHETLHAIKGADEKEYQNLAKLISDYAKANDSEGYEQLVSAMKRDYTAGEVDEEMTAELVGKYLFGEDGEKFIQNIATKEPNIFKRLYDYVMKAFGKDDPELAKIRESFEKIYKQTDGNSETKFSRNVSPNSIPKEERGIILADAYNNWAIEKNMDKTGIVEAHSANYSAICRVKDGKAEILTANEALGRERSEIHEPVGKLYKKPNGFDYDIEGIRDSRKNNGNDSANAGVRQIGGRTDGLDSGRLQEHNQGANSSEGSGFNGGGKAYFDLDKEQSRPKAKSQHLLERAIEMEEDGMSVADIRESTGLFKDSEGTWREAKNGDANFSKKKKRAKPADEAGSFNAEKPVLSDEKIKTNKSVGVGTEHPSNMTRNQIEDELKGIDIARANSKKKNGGVSDNQKIRDARAEALKTELESRKSETVKAFEASKPSKNLREFADEADRLGVDIEEELAEFTTHQNKWNTDKDWDAHDKASAVASKIYQKVDKARLESWKNNPNEIDKSVLDGKEWKSEDLDAMTTQGVTEAFKDAGGVHNLVDEINKAINSGDFGKLKGSIKAEADKIAVADVKANLDEAINKFKNGSFAQDAQMQASRYDAIANELAKKIEANPEDADAIAKLLDVTDHLANNGVVEGKVVPAVLDVSKATPKGRVAVAQRTIDRINAMHSQRIGRTFELTNEEKIKLATTPRGEALDKVYEDIACRVWNDIPATNVEKLNELRHMFMLFNPRTHLRNFFGNGAFWSARQCADNLEILLQNKVFAKGIEKRGGTVTKKVAKRSVLKENKEFLESEFNATYKRNSSKFNESARPDGVTANKGVVGKLAQKDYDLLEAGDMINFKPAFKKEYVRFVTAKGWDISNLSKQQIRQAREVALKEAEYATFRDSCAFSTWLTGKKEFLATAKGKTKMGTAGYRLTNMALDTVIPFVKTPVNVFRRSIDYSPLTLGRALTELASKDPEVFLEGIKHLSTGMTGTGVFGLGWYLTNNEIISVNVGNGQHSGDEYYDRELGYQDYSIVINAGGKKKSITLDWLSPIQTSLFMGAVAHQTFDDIVDSIKEGEPIGEIGNDLMSGLYAMTAPTMDASFMSSTKDLIEKFSRKVEQNSGETNTSVPYALAEVLLADMPKNYISSLVPQVVSQLSKTIDPYQRSTKSTKGGLAGSLESSALQIVNKTPLRVMLNPKLGRRGVDVKSEDNIGMRMFNAFINPSNVKDITENKYDRELIAIRNNIEDKSSTEYKYFFANFTGNPNFELTDGEGRMSYDQAYKYAKASRQEQWSMATEMIDSDRYKKYMTDDMKASEVNSAYHHSLITGDRTISDEYALKKIIDDPKNGKEAEAYKIFAKEKGVSKETREKFLDFYELEDRLYAQSHSSGRDDSYVRKALTAYIVGEPKLAEAYDVDPEKIEAMDKYWKSVKKENGKNAKDVAIKETTMFSCGITACLNEAGFDSKESKIIQSIGAGMMFMKGDKNSERVYRAFNYNWNQAQAGAGICKYNIDGRYDPDKIDEMKAEVKKNSIANGNKDITKAETVKYIQKKLDAGEITQDEASCIYVVLDRNSGKYENPLGDVQDHLEWNTEPDDVGSGKKGRGRRGRRGGWGHGGGGGSKGGAKDWNKYVSDMFGSTGSSSTPKVKNNTSKSSLDDAYRKRVRKMMV